MDSPSAEPRDLETVQAVLDDHLDELERRFPWPSVRAFGVANAKTAEGKLAFDRFVIEAYIEVQDKAPSDPQSIAGVPIRFTVTGPRGNGLVPVG